MGVPKMNPIRRDLLNQLLDSRDEYVSGEELSERLQVSRTAIWKHIEELRKEGYQIEAVRRQGYKLISVPTKLISSTIQPYLETVSFGQKLYVYEQVDSTQAIAHKLAREGAPSGTLVIADQQTAGKGRLGRSWFSPPGTGIWMSLILRPDIPLSSTPQLTLLTAVALAQVFKNYSAGVGIKWPNDLLINGKKVAGILTELNAETDRINYIIIGIGINVNQESDYFPAELESKATSLRIETGQVMPRNKLIIEIIHQWEKLYLLYLEQGFEPVKALWESHAVSLGREIIARTLQGNIKGYAEGITPDGVLLLRDEQGDLHKIYSADIETI